MAKGIIIFGLNGSGKSTVGRRLADIIGYNYMDIEDYYFPDAYIPYSVCRSREECITLMEKEIEASGDFVLSAVTGDFGEPIEGHYRLAVYLQAPKALRLERVTNRSVEKFGNRVQTGGDMYDAEVKFIRMVASRSDDRTNQWAHGIGCPLIRLDGRMKVDDLVSEIIKAYKGL